MKGNGDSLTLIQVKINICFYVSRVYSELIG